jgi:hypothetical protein
MPNKPPFSEQHNGKVSANSNSHLPSFQSNQTKKHPSSPYNHSKSPIGRFLSSSVQKIPKWGSRYLIWWSGVDDQAVDTPYLRKRYAGLGAVTNVSTLSAGASGYFFGVMAFGSVVGGVMLAPTAVLFAWGIDRVFLTADHSENSEDSKRKYAFLVRLGYGVCLFTILSIPLATRIMQSSVQRVAMEQKNAEIALLRRSIDSERKTVQPFIKRRDELEKNWKFYAYKHNKQFNHEYYSNLQDAQNEVNKYEKSIDVYQNQIKDLTGDILKIKNGTISSVELGFSEQFHLIIMQVGWTEHLLHLLLVAGLMAIDASPAILRLFLLGNDSILQKIQAQETVKTLETSLEYNKKKGSISVLNNVINTDRMETHLLEDIRSMQEELYRYSKEIMRDYYQYRAVHLQEYLEKDLQERGVIFEESATPSQNPNPTPGSPAQESEQNINSPAKTDDEEDPWKKGDETPL